MQPLLDKPAAKRTPKARAARTAPQAGATHDPSQAMFKARTTLHMHARLALCAACGPRPAHCSQPVLSHRLRTPARPCMAALGAVHVPLAAWQASTRAHEGRAAPHGAQAP